MNLVQNRMDHYSFHIYPQREIASDNLTSFYLIPQYLLIDIIWVRWGKTMKTNLQQIWETCIKWNKRVFFLPAGPMPVLVKSTATSKWYPPLLIILLYACLVVHWQKLSTVFLASFLEMILSSFLKQIKCTSLCYILNILLENKNILVSEPSSFIKNFKCIPLICRVPGFLQWQLQCRRIMYHVCKPCSPTNER